MGKLLDAVRAKNPAITPEQVQFVTGVETAFDEVVAEKFKENGKDLETRSSTAIDAALNRCIGELPKNDKGETTPIVEQLRSMAEKMDKLQSMSERKMEGLAKFQLRKMINDNFDNIVRDVKTNRVTSLEFEAIRNAAPMTTQNTLTGVNITTGTIPEMDDEIALIHYPENFITDIIRSRIRSKIPATKSKREQDTVEGAATLTAEGAVKPLVSFSFKDKLFTRQKYAAHIEWTEEFEMDKEALYHAIIDLFEVEVLRAWSDGILEKIISEATSYVSTGLDGKVASPNVYTAIGAGILHIQNMLFQPNVLWMNPADTWAMNLTQDTTGQFVLPPATFGEKNSIGPRLYISTKIEQGKFLLGQSDTWREEHTGFSLRIGMINDQFIRNAQTIVGELFSLLYQSEINKPSWLYGDIDAINAALLVEAPVGGGGGNTGT
jgi:hypothetical protein